VTNPGLGTGSKKEALIKKEGAINAKPVFVSKKSKPTPVWNSSKELNKKNEPAPPVNSSADKKALVTEKTALLKPSIRIKPTTLNKTKETSKTKTK